MGECTTKPPLHILNGKLQVTYAGCYIDLEGMENNSMEGKKMCVERNMEYGNMIGEETLNRGFTQRHKEDPATEKKGS